MRRRSCTFFLQTTIIEWRNHADLWGGSGPGKRDECATAPTLHIHPVPDRLLDREIVGTTPLARTGPRDECATPPPRSRQDAPLARWHGPTTTRVLGTHDPQVPHPPQLGLGETSHLIFSDIYHTGSWSVPLGELHGARRTGRSPLVRGGAPDGAGGGARPAPDFGSGVLLVGRGRLPRVDSSHRLGAPNETGSPERILWPVPGSWESSGRGVALTSLSGSAPGLALPCPGGLPGNRDRWGPRLVECGTAEARRGPHSSVVLDPVPITHTGI